MPTRPDHMLLSDGAAESISNAIEYADPLTASLEILVDSNQLPPAADFPVRAALHLIREARKDLHKALVASVAHAKTDPPAGFTLRVRDLDGDAAGERETTLADFLRDNADDADTCASVEVLGVGEEVRLGGGASPLVRIERIS